MKYRFFLTCCSVLLLAASAALGGGEYQWSSFAGSAATAGTQDGTGGAAGFNSPAGAAIDATGNVYVADAGNHTIRKITSAGVVSTLAGTAGNSGFADGTGSAAQFSTPTGVAVDANGTVYVADTGNHLIRKITRFGVVSTLAGFPLSAGSADGVAAAARFSSPKGVAVDTNGNVYVADTGNHTIRKITSSRVVSTYAGRPARRGAPMAPRRSRSSIIPPGWR